ncbi:hypothetical protein NQZ68_003430 [Dissostichus eleginoides]|nr:hypothetical protein NQZ68_003430 [Dissostichus eleginoides]
MFRILLAVTVDPCFPQSGSGVSVHRGAVFNWSIKGTVAEEQPDTLSCSPAADCDPPAVVPSTKQHQPLEDFWYHLHHYILLVKQFGSWGRLQSLCLLPYSRAKFISLG